MAKSGACTVVGGKELERALAEAAEDMVAAGAEAVDESAEEMADDMRAHAPVDTGELLDGIGVRETNGGKEVGVFDVDHALPVEFGASDRPAQPFARPAAEVQRQRFPSKITDKVSKATG